MTDIDYFYFDKEEPVKGCLLALKNIIQTYNKEFISKWYYKLPCFMYKNKLFCYLWVDKKTQFPYIAIGRGVEIEHPDLVQGNRTFVKLLYINPNEDIPINKIYQIFDMALKLYK
ncbi:DUF1801 domain-containing protein [Tenacibaculum halocynthiae]|uniref:DUF1801 domain-containing protein n=1 Tax=Tenacibaculum halocynthiae TaxID=1254437 RepID=UPI003D65BC80